MKEIVRDFLKVVIVVLPDILKSIFSKKSNSRRRRRKVDFDGDDDKK